MAATKGAQSMINHGHTMESAVYFDPEVSEKVLEILTGIFSIYIRLD